jgi:hypothetical protein
MNVPEMPQDNHQEDEVREIHPVPVAPAAEFVAEKDALDNHPEVVALRESQIAAGTFGKKGPATEEMRALCDRITAERKSSTIQA